MKLIHAGTERAKIYVEITLVNVMKGSKMMAKGSTHALLARQTTLLPSKLHWVCCSPSNI